MTNYTAPFYYYCLRQLKKYQKRELNFMYAGKMCISASVIIKYSCYLHTCEIFSGGKPSFEHMNDDK